MALKPITHYAKDLSKWADWQRDYQFGALYLFPPNPLRERVNSLRASYDPVSQAICDAHISLTVSFPHAIRSGDWDELVQVASTIPAFTVTYGPPRTYSGSPGVVLHIEPYEQFNTLVLALESVAAFSGAKPRRYPFSPHMTIAEFISFETSEQLLKALPSDELAGTFECHTIAYAVPDENFRFTERMFLPLKGSKIEGDDPK